MGPRQVGGSEADSLGFKVLSPEVAEKRWADLWGHRKVANGRTFLDLEGARGSVGRGDFNRRWNAQVVQGLIVLFIAAPPLVRAIFRLPAPGLARTVAGGKA